MEGESEYGEKYLIQKLVTLNPHSPEYALTSFSTKLFSLLDPHNLLPNVPFFLNADAV